MMRAVAEPMQAPPSQTPLLHEVLDGLSQPHKRLPPKLFYDERGSRLFERICEQPEYYLPPIERALLRDHAGDLRRFAGARCMVIEPGAGNGDKAPLLLGALDEPVAYVPVEISAAPLERCIARVGTAFRRLRVLPVLADFTEAFTVPALAGAPPRRRLLFFPGSTIGNFDHAAARRLLAGWRTLAGAHGALVIGVDLRKPRQVLERAYDDAAGVTAQFNLNLLRRLNHELDADFDVAAFTHRAWFNEAESRVEMHLVSLRPQRVHIGGRRFVFAAGETLHTENSYKYTPADFAELALAAGWARRELWIDAGDRYSLQCYEPLP